MDYLDKKRESEELLNILKKPKWEENEPIKIKSLASLNENLYGKDDALKACLTPFEEILNGETPIAFNHIVYVKNAIEMLCSEYSNDQKYLRYLKKLLRQAELIYSLSVYRNYQIIKGVNDKFTRLNMEIDAKNERNSEMNLVRLKLMTVTQEMIFIENNIDQIIQSAIIMGINYERYINVEEDDVEQCSNGFCQNQLDKPGKASDAVIVIKNGPNGRLYLLSIKRANGPGRNNIALPGGFLDFCEKTNAIESFQNASIRELNEEVGGINVLLSIPAKVLKLIVEQFHSLSWDPRGRFPEGMYLGAIIVIYDLFEKLTGDFSINVDAFADADADADTECIPINKSTGSNESDYSA